VKTAIAGFLGVPLKAARAKMVDLGFIIISGAPASSSVTSRGAPMRNRLP
jgi:hypothetical protein